MKRATSLLLISAILLAGCRKEASTFPQQPDNTQTEQEQKPSSRPTDFEMGSRAAASWNVKEDIYLKELDLELLRDAPEKIDRSLLKRLLKISTSSVDGAVRYNFTEDDMKETDIERLSYNFLNGTISFSISYKGVTSRSASLLKFSAGSYYALRLPVDRSYISGHYMRGIHEYPSQFIGSVLKIEDERYMPGEIISKGKDDLRNSMTFTFKVHDTVRNEEIVEITKDLSGFRTVQELASAMKIIPTHDLLEAARSAVSSVGTYPGRNLLQVLRLKFGSQKWMDKMQYELDGTLLEYTDSILSGSGEHLDVYLENMRWYLKSAEMKDDVLILEILLESANGIVLQDSSYTVELKGIHSADNQISVNKK